MVAQPGADESALFGWDAQTEVGQIDAGQRASHFAARGDDLGRLRVTRLERGDVAGEGVVQKLADAEAVDVEDAAGLVVHVKEMGIAVSRGFEIHAGRFSHCADLQAGFFEDVEIHLGAALGAFDVGRLDAMRRGGKQHVGDDVCQLAAFGFVESALGDPRRADAHTRRVEGDGVTGDGVAVGDDAHQIEDAHGAVTGEGRAVGRFDRAAINVEQVRVRPAVGDGQAAFLELVCHGDGVLDGLLLQDLELGRARQFEGQRQRGKDVDVRSALFAGEDRLVDQLPQFLVGGHDDRAARTVQGLVRGRGDDVRIADGRGDDSSRHQAADVGNVRQQVGAHRVGDLAVFLPVGNPRVGGIAGDDHLRLVFLRQRHHGVVIDLLGDRVDGVGDDVEVFARAVDRGAVGEMSAVEEVHAHHRVAGLDEGMVHGVVGGSTRKRLHVDVDLVRADAVGGKRLGAAADRQRLDQVGIFDALVIARVGIAAVMGQLGGVIEDFLLGWKRVVSLG